MPKSSFRWEFEWWVLEVRQDLKQYKCLLNYFDQAHL